VNKNPKIPEDDWKKTWKPGTYRYLAPGYKPGTHEVERGDVTWHQLRTMGNAKDAASDNASHDQSLREDSEI
jgi:hypothetical protein